MMQSTGYSVPAATTPAGVIRSTPWPSVSTRWTVGRLYALRYSSWKHGRLQSWRYQALGRRAVAGSSTIASTRARISVIFSKSAFSKSASRSAKLAGSVRGAESRPRIRLARSVHPSLTRSSAGDSAADMLATKFSSQRSCQPGVARPANHRGSIGWLSRTSTDEGVRWKTNSSPAAGQVRDALHRRRAGADDGHPLAGEAVHRRAVRAAPGVGVVPSAGVERVALERLDATDARQLRDVQRTHPERHEPGGELVPSVRPDDPPAAADVPLQVGDLGVEQGTLTQPVARRDPVAVLDDLRSVRVPLGRHVPGLLEQRQVDHRGGVAL